MIAIEASVLDEDLFGFPDDQQEDEDDLQKVSFKDAVVTNVDWTIESINLQMTKGTIDLHPSFQRRGAWDEKRKSRLIESIIVGMPVPNIALAENKEHRGRFIVIDGKQRLLAIEEFIANKYKLRGLDLRGDLNGTMFATLATEDRESFENSTLRATLIKNWQDENFLWAAFYRLNVGSMPLSPQELRKALIGGKLIDAIENYLCQSVDFQAVFGKELDKRMRDSELVLRFLAFDRAFASYRGDFKAFLDETTKNYELNWDTESADASARFARLDLALRTAREIFSDDVFRKWLGTRYERVMNRAIFDCIVRFFADSGVAALAVSNRGAVVTCFQQICLDTQFRRAIEGTTKTLDATKLRLSVWGDRLATLVGMSFDSVELRIR